jgi:LysM repeat protein
VVREPDIPPPEARLPTSVAPPTDASDKQFEILTEAVDALRQEVARGDTRSQELVKENKRLRALVDSLLRDLTKSRGEDQRLKNQVQALEKQLREIGVTPPEAAGERREGSGESAEAVPNTRSDAAQQGSGALAGRVPGAKPTRGDGLYHVVAAGESLFRIARAYGVDYRDLASENGIEDPAHIEVGQRIFIPGATR